MRKLLTVAILMSFLSIPAFADDSVATDPNCVPTFDDNGQPAGYTCDQGQASREPAQAFEAPNETPNPVDNDRQDAPPNEGQSE